MSNTRVTNFMTHRFEADLVIDTNAFASGDVLSDRVAVTLMTPIGGQPLRGAIVGVTLLDKDDEGGVLDLVFLDDNVSLGTVNAAASISDANAERVLGVINVTTYDDLGGCKIARPSFDEIPFEISGGVLYVGAISRDTKTYTAASDLRLKLFIRLDNACY